jgi:hypothetical protein
VRLPSRRELLLLLAVLGLPFAAGSFGSRQAQTLALNLGPFDEPWLTGFAEEHEILTAEDTERSHGVHWSGTQAGIHWPVSVEGDGLRLRYRASRVLPQTAEVEVRLDGLTVDRFQCRGGRWHERSAPGAGRSGTPLVASFVLGIVNPAKPANITSARRPQGFTSGCNK